MHHPSLDVQSKCFPIGLLIFLQRSGVVLVSECLLPDASVHVKYQGFRANVHWKRVLKTNKNHDNLILIYPQKKLGALSYFGSSHKSPFLLTLYNTPFPAEVSCSQAVHMGHNYEQANSLPLEADQMPSRSRVCNTRPLAAENTVNTSVDSWRMEISTVYSTFK